MMRGSRNVLFSCEKLWLAAWAKRLTGAGL